MNDEAPTPRAASAHLHPDQFPLLFPPVEQESLAPIDDDFRFDYVVLPDLADGERPINFWDVEPLCRGPEPWPDWLVTDRAAVDVDLGVLKTGKEADVFVVERGVPGGPTMTVAAKRYRSTDHRTFHRSAAYTEGRRVRNTRDARAMHRKSSFGKEIAAGQWAWAEWELLGRCHSAGVPVPYPIQLDGTEILMELVCDDDGPAPRLAQSRPGAALLRSYFDQLRDAMAQMALLGLAHGDLSAYNLLAAGDRLVVIDMPQAVDLVANPTGTDFLLRDCRNVCRWFTSRGLDCDADALFGELVAAAFG